MRAARAWGRGELRVTRFRRAARRFLRGRKKVYNLALAMESGASCQHLGPFFGAQKHHLLLENRVLLRLVFVLSAGDRDLLTDLTAKLVGMDDLLHKPEGHKRENDATERHSEQAQPKQKRAGEAALFPSRRRFRGRSEKMSSSLLSIAGREGIVFGLLGCTGVHGFI